MKSYRALGVLAPMLFLSFVAHAQTPAPNKPEQVIGEIVSVDAGSRRVTLKTDNGATAELTLRANAPVLRVQPGSMDLKTAARITLAEVSPGDRVAATAYTTAGNREAGTLLVMSKPDVARQQQRDAEDWQKRGTGGIVTSVDATAAAVTIRAGQRILRVQTTPKTDIRRYAAESIRYSDATPSTLAAIREGDQVRVLGERSPDGASITAERIVSGAFRQHAGTVKSVDAERGDIQIEDLATKAPITVRINSDSKVRRLPEALASTLATRMTSAAGGRGQTARGQSSSADRQQTEQGGTPSTQVPTGARAANDINQMLDRLPAVALPELKVGEAVLLSGMGSEPGRLTAVILLAGVDPLLRASPTAARDLMGGWLRGEAGDAEGQ